MSEQTKIAWCDSTVNFWRGCDKVSPGCVNCYITTTTPFRTSGQKHGDPRVHGDGAVKLALALNRRPWICPVCGHAMTEEESKGYIGCPAKTDEDKGPFNASRVMHVAQHHRRRIFSLSLGDWLDDKVPVEWLAEMLDTIRQCDQVTWILCTKRPENWARRIYAARNWLTTKGSADTAIWLNDWLDKAEMPGWPAEPGKPPKNIILLTSVENQTVASPRINALFNIPAACRGVSFEPLLGPVDLRPVLTAQILDWLIIGGESGDNARACDVDWIRSLVQQGRAAGVPTFVKQMGEYLAKNMRRCGHDVKHKKGGDPSEWPPDLRVREFPVL